MIKYIIACIAVWIASFVLFDTTLAFAVEATFAVAWWIPGKAWLAIGEACADMAPWLFLANIDL